MSGHIHAELMAQYAEDARETDKPWKLWQIREDDDSQEWQDCACPCSFLKERQYRRKPRTITINGREVPEPMRSAPQIGEMYYLASPCASQDGIDLTWRSSSADIRWLSQGLCHSTKEAAIAHVEALLSFTECK